MDNEPLLSAIIENFHHFSMPQDINSYNKAKLTRKKIIDNKDNLSSLINIFMNTKLQPECQIYILKMIRDMIDIHLNMIQLDQITTSFTQTNLEIVSNSSVISMLGDLMGYSSRLIFQNEMKFIFAISDNVVNCSKLQWDAFYYAIEYIDNGRLDVTDLQNMNIAKAFKQQFLLSFFYLSLRTIDFQLQNQNDLTNLSPDFYYQIDGSIKILLRCLVFDSASSNKMLKVDSICKTMLNALQDSEIFKKFLIFLTNFKSPISSNILNIIKAILLMISIPSAQDYLQLYDLILELCSNILKINTFFMDEKNIYSFNALLRGFPKNVQVIMKCDKFINELLNFIMFNLTSNYRLAVQMLPGALTFFELAQLNISRNSPSYQLYSDLLGNFIQATMNIFETEDLEAAYDILLLSQSERKETKQILLLLFSLSNSKKNEVILGICDMIAQLTQKQFNMITNVQLGFLLFVVRIEFKKYLNLQSPTYFAAFNSFLYTNDKVQNYYDQLKENLPNPDDIFSLEYYSLAFMKSFFKTFISGRFSVDRMPNLDKLFESPEMVVIFIFQRFWSDVINEICPEKAKKCLRKIIDSNSDKNISNTPLRSPLNASLTTSLITPLNSPLNNALITSLSGPLKSSINPQFDSSTKDESDNNFEPSYSLKVISSTDYPSIFLNNYLNYPCKSIIYYTIVNIMICSDATRPLFFNSFEENFLGKTDKDSLKKFFKLLKSWFLSTKQLDKWKQLYLYYDSKFYTMLVEIASRVPEFVYLLKFLNKVTHNMPVSSPFQTNEPFSFRLVRRLTEMLITITKTSYQFLHEIKIDDSIIDTGFISDLYDSKPISLSEAHSIGMNERQTKIKQNQSATFVDNWHEAWSLIPMVLEPANDLFKSSIPNFGIMQLYNDQCVFSLFDTIIDAISVTSLLSLLSHQILIANLSEFIFIMMKYFRSSIISNEKFASFIVEFLRISFFSHIRDVLKTTCQTLGLLVRGFTSPQDVIILRQHFILSFNLAIYFADSHTAAEFSLLFAKIDPEFVTNIGKLIEDDLLPEVRQIFHDNFSKLWTELSKVDPDDISSLSIVFKNFLSSIAQYSIKLYSLPSLSQYFTVS